MGFRYNFSGRNFSVGDKRSAKHGETKENTRQNESFNTSKRGGRQKDRQITKDPISPESGMGETERQ
jgi:hypothetical protein